MGPVWEGGGGLASCHPRAWYVRPSVLPPQVGYGEEWTAHQHEIILRPAAPDLAHLLPLTIELRVSRGHNADPVAAATVPAAAAATVAAGVGPHGQWQRRQALTSSLQPLRWLPTIPTVLWGQGQPSCLHLHLQMLRQNLRRQRRAQGRGRPQARPAALWRWMTRLRLWRGQACSALGPLDTSTS